MPVRLVNAAAEGPVALNSACKRPTIRATLEIPMGEMDVERRALADYIGSRRTAILESWRGQIKRDPTLNTGDSLPRSQLFDHIPAILATFERELRNAPADDVESASAAAQASAAAHGLQRWQQGYDLREVTRELGKLNECVILELDDYSMANPHATPAVIAGARRVWAALCSTGIEESVGQYFHLQQQEAAGHVRDLEAALAEIRELEQQRADLWRQAAHDLRGNLGVVANATVGLTHSGLGEATRDDFVRILMRNVTTLHHLLDDVTSLARLQAGRELRQIEPLDVTPILVQLCEGIQPLAQQRRLYLRCEGPPGFAADGDAVKIRRIAQNLILNAVKFTRQGGITVSWGDSDALDPKRWQMSIADTGPGFVPHTAGQAPRVHEEAGEGIGLSIVKRLCELLDATIDVRSEVGVGTTFRILFPRTYAH
jgi:signal transduction histidine kinase